MITIGPIRRFLCKVIWPLPVSLCFGRAAAECKFRACCPFITVCDMIFRLRLTCGTICDDIQPMLHLAQRTDSRYLCDVPGICGGGAASLGTTRRITNFRFSSVSGPGYSSSIHYVRRTVMVFQKEPQRNGWPKPPVAYFSFTSVSQKGVRQFRRCFIYKYCSYWVSQESCPCRVIPRLTDFGMSSSIRLPCSYTDSLKSEIGVKTILERNRPACEQPPILRFSDCCP